MLKLVVFYLMQLACKPCDLLVVNIFILCTLPPNNEVLIIQLQSVAVITESRKKQEEEGHILAGVNKNLFIAKGLEVLHICLFHRMGICLL